MRPSDQDIAATQAQLQARQPPPLSPTPGASSSEGNPPLRCTHPSARGPSLGDGAECCHLQRRRELMETIMRRRQAARNSAAPGLKDDVLHPACNDVRRSQSVAHVLRCLRPRHEALALPFQQLIAVRGSMPLDGTAKNLRFLAVPSRGTPFQTRSSKYSSQVTSIICDILRCWRRTDSLSEL